MGFVPAVCTNQSTFVVAAPVTVAVNAFVLAAPACMVQESGAMVTTGGGVMVTVALADTVMSSNAVAETITAAGEGAVFGA